MKNNILIKNILNSVKLAVKHNSKKLHEPIFKGNEKRYLKKCIETGYVSYIGKYVNTFERKISKYTGSKNAVALVNGTCALHILLKSGTELYLKVKAKPRKKFEIRPTISIFCFFISFIAFNYYILSIFIENISQRPFYNFTFLMN